MQKNITWIEICRTLFMVSFISIMFRTFCYADNNVYIQASAGTGFAGNFYRTAPEGNSYTYTLGLSGGYIFNKYFSVNGGINYVPYYSANIFLSDIAARGMLPLSDFVSVYFELGPGMMNGNQQVINSSIVSTQNVNIFAPYTSVGAIFKLNDSLGINVNDYGYFPVNSSASPINMLNLGVYYAF